MESPFSKLEIKKDNKLVIRRDDGVEHAVNVTPELAKKVKGLEEDEGPKLLTEADPAVFDLERRRGA